MDGSGVPTDMLTLNSGVKIFFRNPATFFGVHVTATPLQLHCYDLMLASGMNSLIMEKDLVAVFQKVADAASAGEEGRCVDALKVLKRFPITKDVLISTKIGAQLRPYTKHPKKIIQAAASDVLEKWKGIFKQKCLANINNNNGGHTVSKSIKEEGSLPGSGNQGKREIVLLKAALVPTRSTREKQGNDKNARDTIRELLEVALGKVALEVDDQNLREEVNGCDPHHVASMVEDELFKNWGSCNAGKKTKFIHRYRSLKFNIQDPKNPDFRRRVLLGHLPPESIVVLSAEGMASDARRLENDKIREQAMFDCELVETAEASSLGMKCAKCKKDQTTYYQMQTRRADEPMTAFVTCLNCGNRWRG